MVVIQVSVTLAVFDCALPALSGVQSFSALSGALPSSWSSLSVSTVHLWGNRLQGATPCSTLLEGAPSLDLSLQFNLLLCLHANALQQIWTSSSISHAQ